MVEACFVDIKSVLPRERIKWSCVLFDEIVMRGFEVVWMGLARIGRKVVGAIVGVVVRLGGHSGRSPDNVDQRD